MNEIDAEFQHVFDERARQIDREREERAHLLDMAKLEKRQRAQQTADALTPLLDQLDRQENQ